MFYSYICEECNKEIEIQMSPKEKIPRKIECTHCGHWAYRNYKGASIIVPEWFRSVSSSQNGDNPTNLSNLRNRLNHTRPSGREKIYW